MWSVVTSWVKSVRTRFAKWRERQREERLRQEQYFRPQFDALEPLAGTVTFTEGETYKTVDVSITSNDLDEDDEVSR